MKTEVLNLCAHNNNIIMLCCCRLSFISEYVCATNQLLCLLSTSVAAKYFTYFNSFLFLLVMACFYLWFLYHLATYCLHHHNKIMPEDIHKRVSQRLLFLLWLQLYTSTMVAELYCQLHGVLGFTLLYSCFIFRSTFSINIKDDST